MSAGFDATEELTATGPTISASTWLVPAVYVKLPSPFVDFGSQSHFLRFAGSTHFLALMTNTTPNPRLSFDYSVSGLPTGGTPPLNAWVCLIGKAPPNDGTTQSFAVYDDESSTGSGDPNATLSRATNNAPQNLNSINIGSTNSSNDIPGAKVAEPCIFSAANETVANAIIDALIGGTEPANVASGTLLWHRTLRENGTEGAGTGDLTGTGVTYDGEDHPFEAAGGSSELMQAMII